MDLTAEERRAVWVQGRARMLKHVEAEKAWLMAGLRAWLTAPVSEGGLGFDAARTEKALGFWTR